MVGGTTADGKVSTGETRSYSPQISQMDADSKTENRRAHDRCCRPAVDEIDDGIAGVVGNPILADVLLHEFSSANFVLALELALEGDDGADLGDGLGAFAGVLDRSRAVLEEGLLPTVDAVDGPPVRLADVRDGFVFQHVGP